MVIKYDRPPDGGWGWAIVFTTTMTYAIAWGIPRAMSVLFLDLQQKFETSNANTSWITSLMFGCFACGALFGSLVTSLIGPRRTMMLGGLIACMGIIIVSQAPLLHLVYVGSAIAGIGFGFTYCNATSQLGMYFDKKRALVFGIATIGAPLGGMILPVLLTTCLPTYGLEGTLLIEAGICLNLVMCGALLRPVIIGNATDTSKERIAVVDDTTGDTCTNIVFSDTVSIASLDDVTSTVLYSAPSPILRRRHLSPHKAVLMRSLLEKVDLENDEENDKVPGSGKDQVSDENKNRIDVKRKPEEGCSEKKEVTLRSTFGPYVGLLCNWRFMLFCVVGFLDFFVRCVPTWFIVVHAESLGMSNTMGATLLIVFSVADGSTKLLTGYFGGKIPKEKVDKGYEVLCFGAAQIFMCVSSLAIPAGYNYGTIALPVAFYAVGNAVNSTYCMIILSRLTCLDHLHHAIGLFHFLSGLGILMGPPLTGYLADVTGNYNIVFYFTSALMFLSVFGILALFLLIQKFGIRKNKDRQSV